MSTSRVSIIPILLAVIFLAANCRYGDVAKESLPTENKQAESAKPIDGSTVTIDSPDGVKLVGTFFEAAKPNAPALLLLHQWQSDRHSFDDFAKQMQSKGFAVLSVDGRGFGESTKKADGTIVTAGRTDADVKGMLGDVGAAFDFLAKQKNVDPSRIGIVGASYGSSLALIFSADKPAVKTVVLLSPGLNYFGNMQTEPAVKKYGQRGLLLVAADDDTESAESVRKLQADAGSGKCEIKIYEKGGHGTALFRSQPGLEDLLETFLAKSLGN